MYEDIIFLGSNLYEDYISLIYWQSRGSKGTLLVFSPERIRFPFFPFLRYIFQYSSRRGLSFRKLAGFKHFSGLSLVILERKLFETTLSHRTAS
jgi:hypothetical protein